jgi:hypothetical protein
MPPVTKNGKSSILCIRHQERVIGPRELAADGNALETLGLFAFLVLHRAMLNQEALDLVVIYSV